MAIVLPCGGRRTLATQERPSYRIDLAVGWNLISCLGTPEDTSVESLLDPTNAVTVLVTSRGGG